ncbi:hypothetical protein DFP72DRAFT_536606 [Ephemerocybe angulata]|uniref:G domain-containing protein n=1 Tax=Ephemerocybe angulata TaxID=980116 RepID=A0A8H6HQ41_9AGAR|nr:hypothetical protein DFP72DRAFT_536606 [Tulosesus angulatus]
MMEKTSFSSGKRGVGKSSIINMLLAGKDDPQYSGTAMVSGDATGGTSENAKYTSNLEGSPTFELNLWDTSGFAESDTGKVTAAEASQNLGKLINERLKGRVGLLVFCIKGRPFRPIVKQLYNQVYNKICQRSAPIILVVTGLENEANREYWWDDNKGDFGRHNMTFDAHACITSTRGRLIQEDGVPRSVFDKEYVESIGAVQAAIREGLSSKRLQVPAVPPVKLPVDTKGLHPQDSKKKKHSIILKILRRWQHSSNSTADEQ